MERKTVIKLSGSMAQRFGRTHRRALTSASEVFRALSNTIDGFDAYLREARAKDWILLFSGIVAISGTKSLNSWGRVMS
jgi:predicted phage tail protein